MNYFSHQNMYALFLGGGQEANHLHSLMELLVRMSEFLLIFQEEVLLWDDDISRQELKKVESRHCYLYWQECVYIQGICLWGWCITLKYHRQKGFVATGLHKRRCVLLLSYKIFLNASIKANLQAHNTSPCNILWACSLYFPISYVWNRVSG